MTTVSTLGRQALGERLAKGRIILQTGCFSSRIQTHIDSIIDAIALLYGDHQVLDDDGFADFHIAIERAQGLRGILRPQAMFYFDGKPMFQPLPYKQAFPMFEWGLNWCISSLAHRYLMIHAAVVERNGCAAILPAPPGSGKSTLCAALVHNGWRLLSDELTLIGPEDGQVLPLPRPISLKNASIDVIRRYVPNTVFSPAVGDTAKGTLAHLKAPADSVARGADTARPAWVIFPKYIAGSATVLQPIARSRAFMRVAENSFNYSVLGARGFDTMAGLTEQSDAYDFSYSDLDEAMALFASLADRPEK